MCEYEDDVDRIQCDVLGFCGCGDPERNLKFIRDGLRHINKERSSDTTLEDFHKWYGQWHEEGEKIFGNDQSREFFFYWTDKEEYTEHGSSIPGWLTEKGKKLLADIEKALEE